MKHLVIVVAAILQSLLLTSCGGRTTTSGATATCITTQTCKVKLRWDANTETDLAGYRVYHGSMSRTLSGWTKYDQMTDNGNVITATVEGLGGGSISFAVTAYNTANLESSYSNEVTVDMDAEIGKLQASTSTIEIKLGK